jgi:hypothetical protein
MVLFGTYIDTYIRFLPVWRCVYAMIRVIHFFFATPGAVDVEGISLSGNYWSG